MSQCAWPDSRNGVLRGLAIAALLFGRLVIAPEAGAADLPAGFSVEGQVTQPLHLTVADLKQMSGIEVDASFENKAGVEKASYVGVSLKDLLDQAKVIDGSEKGARFHHTIDVVGIDGYTVSVAIGEIDPFLEGKPVLIAYLRDGKPVDPAGSVRLIVPNDHHGARSVRDVVKVELK